MEKRSGILSGGNWIVDFIKLIDTYPSENALANIREEKTGYGGAPFNVLKALRKMRAEFPLEGIGLVGDDAIGKEVFDQCEALSINTRQLRAKEGCGTSFTDVMTVQKTGRRTFFHFRGASAHLSAKDFDFSESTAKFFHLGYLLLLDELDRIDESGRSEASKVLETAVNSGLITSVDIVSEQSDRYREVIPSSLPFVDILFLNEFETKGLTGLNILGEDGAADFQTIAEAAKVLFLMGVREWIVFHFPRGAVAVEKSGQSVFQPRVNFPQNLIKGTVGAGDAFAAGVLFGLHEGWSMKDALKCGVCVAGTSLLSADASEGILPWQECIQFGDEWGYSS